VSRNTIDKVGERITRRIASYSSRRGFLSRLGMALVCAPAIPLLPVARAQSPTSGPNQSAALTNFTLHAQAKDDKLCSYWRYCALDGDLCSCMGGGVHTCPPGALPSPTAWVGSCVNPEDSKSYLIAYHDCCGKNDPQPGKDCSCEATDRNLPMYRPMADQDIVWCFGLSSFTYHCSTAVLVGLAD
jgi:methylamine dehydrogenase light chain